MVYKIEFLSNANPALKAAEFGIIGDGGTDVDIEVYDANGKMIASDTNYSDIAFVRWAPNQTQIYTIRVKNLGTEDNTCHFTAQLRIAAKTEADRTAAYGPLP